MQYRTLGRTGLKVSEIGLGCEGFSGRDLTFTRKMLDLAIENGVNCMDLFSPDPNLRDCIGAALKGRHHAFVLQAHLCTVWEKGQYRRTREIEKVKASFEDLLMRLGTQRVDIGMIHYVDSLDDWQKVRDGAVMRYALLQKAQGRIGAVGMSSHNPQAALAAVQSGLVDVIMFSVNPCYDLLPAGEDCEALWARESYQGMLVNMDPQRQELYETCQKLGVGLTVMKVFGGGDLLTQDSPAGQALSVVQCLHYALTRPAAATVFVGARSLEELEQSLAYVHADASQRDYAQALAGFPRISWQGHCMYCGHCAPCPQGIDVAAATKFLNLAKAQGDAASETIFGHYEALARHAKDCTGCGLCETRCPFGVPVRENMKRAIEIFGN